MTLAEWESRMTTAAKDLTPQQRERVRDALAFDDMAWVVAQYAFQGRKMETAWNKAHAAILRVKEG